MKLRLFISGTICVAVVMAFAMILLTSNSSWSKAATQANAAQDTTTTTIPPYCMPDTPPSDVPMCEQEHATMVQQGTQQWPSSGTPIAESAAIADATPNAGPNLKVYAAQMTYGQAGQYLETSNSQVVSSTPVWVVTVNLPTAVANEMGPPGVTQSTYDVYTVVEDAINGADIDACTKCDVVQADGSLQSALQGSS